MTTNSKKFDFKQDCSKRSWNIDCENRLKAVSWFKKKLRFIIKIRHLKAEALNGYFSLIRAYEIESIYRERLQSLDKREDGLLQRERMMSLLEAMNRSNSKTFLPCKNKNNEQKYENYSIY